LFLVFYLVSCFFVILAVVFFPLTTLSLLGIDSTLVVCYMTDNQGSSSSGGSTSNTGLEVNTTASRNTELTHAEFGSVVEQHCDMIISRRKVDLRLHIGGSTSIDNQVTLGQFYGHVDFCHKSIANSMYDRMFFRNRFNAFANSYINLHGTDNSDEVSKFFQSLAKTNGVSSSRVLYSESPSSKINSQILRALAKGPGQDS